MSRRRVLVVNADSPTAAPHRAANFARIRVEVRVIFPPQATFEEIHRVLNNAGNMAFTTLQQDFEPEPNND
jgi:hypothetical protein